MKAETIFEVIKKLTGEVEPVADSAVDAERLKNMQTFTHVCEMMLFVIGGVAAVHKESNFYSAREIARVAEKFLKDMGMNNHTTPEEVNTRLNNQ